jgi:DnaJ-class molecular chaperone
MNKPSAAPFPDSSGGKQNPGDETAPGSAQTGEDICPECSGSGKRNDQTDCPNCGGTGRIVKIIGDA